MNDKEPFFYDDTGIEMKRYDLVFDKENNDYGIITAPKGEPEIYSIDEDMPEGEQLEVYCAWFRTKEDALEAFNPKTKKIDATKLSSCGYARCYSYHLSFVKRLGITTWKEKLGCAK